MKAPVKQEKTLVGAFSVIVQLGRLIVNSSPFSRHRPRGSAVLPAVRPPPADHHRHQHPELRQRPRQKAASSSHGKGGGVI